MLPSDGLPDRVGRRGEQGTGTRIQTAAIGIAILAHGCYHQGMKTLTMKVPDGLLGWLENEAKRARQPKSALVREILQQHRQRRHQSALDLAADLCG